jgi:hypothetical protein
MYSPTLGRFLQTDPVGYADDLHLYAYVKNNPVNLTDPGGMIASLSGNLVSNSTTAAANVAAQSSTGGAKLDGAAIDMPKSEMGEAIQVVGSSGTPGNNKAKNKQFNDVVVRLRLTQTQARLLHEEIAGRNPGFYKILQIGRGMFNK